MFCENCGGMIEENSTFCMECGNPIITTVSVATTRANDQNRPMRVWLVVLCALIIPISIVFTLLITQGFYKYELPNEINSGQEESHTSSVDIESVTSITITPPPVNLKYFCTASSYLNHMNSKYIYYPRYLGDNSAKTAWIEGANGAGIGEWIKLEFGQKYKLSGISIINGWAKSYKTYNNESRVKRIRIETSEGYSQEAYLNDGMLNFQDVYFAQEVVASSVFLTILDTYKGDDDLFTAISEIKVF